MASVWPSRRQGTGLLAPSNPGGLHTTSGALLPSRLLTPCLPSPLSCISSDRPVARGRRAQHGQPPLRLQHLRQSLQHHPGCHNHPGKRGGPGAPSCSSLGCRLQLQGAPGLPSERKMRALITAPRPIYDSVIKHKLLFHMEMIFDEFQSSWGRGVAWRDITVCGCLFQGPRDSQGGCAWPREGGLLQQGWGEKPNRGLDPVHHGGPYSFTTAFLAWCLLCIKWALAVDTPIKCVPPPIGIHIKCARPPIDICIKCAHPQ